MSKVEINIPEQFPFSIEIPIRRIDLSLDLHVSFASILDLVMEAHLQFLQNYGFTPSDICGKSVIFADANIIYQGELLFNDQVRIDVSPSNFFEKGFDYIFKITKNKGTIPIALIKIRVLFFDYSIKKVITVPENFKSLFVANTKNPSPMIVPDFPLWKKAHKFVLQIYSYAGKFPSEEATHLTYRIRKSATSLPLYILEGLKKKDKSVAIKLYQKARGCIEEMRYYLILASDLNYGESSILINELDNLNVLIKKEFNLILNTK